MEGKRLYKAAGGSRVLFGVCGGVAEYFQCRSHVGAAGVCSGSAALGFRRFAVYHRSHCHPRAAL